MPASDLRNKGRRLLSLLCLYARPQVPGPPLAPRWPGLSRPFLQRAREEMLCILQAAGLTVTTEPQSTRECMGAPVRLDAEMWQSSPAQASVAELSQRKTGMKCGIDLVKHLSPFFSDF